MQPSNLNLRQIRLFAFAYAGGSSNIFNSWKKQLHSDIELIPVELPGHGGRMSEPLLERMGQVIESAWQDIQPYLQDNREFAFIGHSMGSMLAFEMIHKVHRETGRYPICSFFAGRVPPHISRDHQWGALPDDQFMEKVRTLGGLPDAVLEHEELLQLFLPILRADFRLVEDYRYDGQYPSLPLPIFVMTGEQDHMTNKDIQGWSSYSAISCRYFTYPDGHFFINTCAEQVIRDVNNTFAEIINSQSSAYRS